MGMIFGTTDYETTYKFYIARDGVEVQAPETRHSFVIVPGIDGVRDYNLALSPRTITVTGHIIQTTNANLMSSLISMEADLLGSLSSSSSPTYETPYRSLKDLILPNFSSKKFPNCRCVSWRIVKFFGPRTLATICTVEIKFLQTRPFTSSV